MITLMKELIAAVRELAASLRTVLRVNASDSTRSTSTPVPFDGTITGTDVLTVWTPRTGRRFRVKCVSAVGAVDTQLAASNAVTFYFADETSGLIVAPISAAPATAAAGTLLPSTGTPVELDLREGVVGTVVEGPLCIKSSASISTGVVRFAGIVLGEEVV